MKVYRHFTFDAAHSLPFLPETHKCHRKHGHTYHVTVFVDSNPVENVGFDIDYADIDAAWQTVAADLDHHDIDAVVLPWSTCENLVRYIWRRLRVVLPGVCRVQVQETANCGVEYDGE